jgi:glycerol-3-phosphate dehydrogenase
MDLPVAGRCTHRLPLDGGDLGDPSAFATDCDRRYGAALGRARLERHATAYGSHLHAIMERISQDPQLLEPVPGFPLSTRAEVEHVLHNELVCTVDDLIRRRTDFGSLGCPADATLAYCGERLAAHQGLAPETMQNQIREARDGYPSWLRPSK